MPKPAPESTGSEPYFAARANQLFARCRAYLNAIYHPTMPRARNSTDTWLFWMVALLVIAAGLGLRDPWPADEPRFVLAARHMIESGDWLFPRRGTELYTDKPPMFMWLQAVAYLVVGNWRVAFLLPSLLAALGTLWCVVDLGQRLWTRRVGLYAGWSLLFTLQFTFQAKAAQIDPLVTFWITLANYGLLRHVLSTRTDPQPNWGMWTLGWFAAGLGTITKGVGVLALLMLVPALFATLFGWRFARMPRRDARILLGPLAFVVAVSLWLVPMLTSAMGSSDPAYHAYYNDILFHQTVGRFVRSWDHAQPPWYMLEMMLTIWLPPLLALPWALPAWKRRLRRRDARYLLPLAWWISIVVFFSIPSGKRDVYIMPALPMMCLALAPLLPGIVRKVSAQRVALTFGACIAIAMLGVGLELRWGGAKAAKILIVERGLSLAQAREAAYLVTAIGAWSLGCLLWFGRRRAHIGLVTMLAGMWVMYGLIAYPLLTDSSSSRGLMLEAGRAIGLDAQLGLVAWQDQNLLMADRPVATFGFSNPWPQQFQRAVVWQSEAPQKRWVMVQGVALPACVDRTRGHPIGLANRRTWWMLPSAAVSHCQS